MSRLLYSVAGLVLFVALIALGLGALKAPSELWGSFFFTLAIVLLTTSLLGALACGGRTRRRCMAFCVFGGVYWALSFAPWFASEVRPFLLTSYVGDLSYRKMHLKNTPSVFVRSITVSRGSEIYSNDNWNTLYGDKFYQDYNKIVHSLWTILAGLTGFAALRLLYDRGPSAT